MALSENLENETLRGTRAKEFVDVIEKYAGNYEDIPVSELLTKVLEDTGYEQMLRTEGAQDRLDNLAELKQSVFEYETTCGEEVGLEDYLKHIALFTNADSDAGEQDKVRLMTVHAAKGLEFPYVFLCGMNEGIFPSRKVHTLEGMEEERRLAFVAITRAKDTLFLTEAMGRNFDGSPRFPSRFLFDIDKKYLEYINEPNDALIKETKEYIELYDKSMIKDKKDLFEEGSRVKHLILGEGTIVSIDSDMQAYVIKFDSSETERMISFKVSLDLL
jgi:DNA helicase-2/ATP-dependent DNA helicase PcrA